MVIVRPSGGNGGGGIDGALRLLLLLPLQWLVEKVLGEHLKW